MKYCKDNKVGAKAAVKTGKFPGVQWKALDRRLKGEIINGTEHEARSLLLFEEERRLCQWILECGTNMMGRDREMVGEKVVQILRERKARIRGKAGKNYKKLSSAAKAVLQKGARAINKHWYQRFYGFWHYEVAEKTVSKVEKTRVAKCTEATVEEHFFAEGAGLRDTLIKAGVMDPETGRIPDPRR
eukprot:3645725-Pyramimonas_sp.AAC.1